MDQFVNFYDVLQISPEAEQETVLRVYRVMASRFHPDNRDTGNVERFIQITEAYQVLSDASKRNSYDREFKSRRHAPLPVFMTPEFSDGIASESKIRLGMLCLLYLRRRNNVNQAAMSLVDLESMMSIPREHLMFASWYLRMKKFIVVDDRSSLTITAEGVDFLELQLPGHQNLYDVFREAETGSLRQMPALTEKSRSAA